MFGTYLSTQLKCCLCSRQKTKKSCLCYLGLNKSSGFNIGAELSYVLDIYIILHTVVCESHIIMKLTYYESEDIIYIPFIL